MCFSMPMVAVTKAERKDGLTLVQIAEEKAPKIGAAFVGEFNDKQKLLDDLPDGLVNGDADQLIEELGLSDDKKSLSTFRDGLRAGIEGGAESTVPTASAAITESAGPNIVVAYDKYDPSVIEFIKDYEFGLITRVNKRQRSMIRSKLKKAIKQGDNPRVWAREIRPNLGLSDDLTKALGSFESALKGGSKAQLKQLLNRNLRDKRFDARLKRMVDGERLPDEQIQKMIDRYAERALKYRAERIARTEALRAVHAGQHLTWTQAADAGGLDKELVRRFWIATNDDRTRSTHATIPGDNAKGVGLEEPFETAVGQVMYPPAEVLCRCTTFYRIMERDSAGNIIQF